MGYSTNFTGKIKIEPTLTDEHLVELNDFSDERHEDERKYPGIWCQWISDNGEFIEWNGGEKFYNYVEWMQWLIENFFQPYGYILNGTIEYQGEQMNDRGVILVNNNILRHKTYNDVVESLDKHMEIVQKLATYDINDTSFNPILPDDLRELIREAKLLTKTE